jgi:hypothetical protein
MTCPLGTCSKYLNFEDNSVGIKFNNSYIINKEKYNKKTTELKSQLNQISRHIENIKNKIHTKYMGPGTIFLVMSLYLAFL